MANKATIETPADYLASLAEPRRSQITELDALIRKTVPSLHPFIYSGMLAYGPYHYVYASGREGDSAIVSLSSRAQYISLYLGVCDEHGYLAEQAKPLLPKANIGKSCIRFKRLEDIDLTVIRELLKKAEKWAKGQAKLSNEAKKAAAKSGHGVSARSPRKKSS
jgi:hypothetical protein